ncbi:hypothetical protein IscW_ISCW001250, partial [Ixodes scapularis]
GVTTSGSRNPSSRLASCSVSCAQSPHRCTEVYEAGRLTPARCSPPDPERRPATPPSTMRWSHAPEPPLTTFAKA